jgi:hypothetical protein
MLVQGTGTSPDSTRRELPTHKAIAMLAFDVARTRWLRASPTEIGPNVTAESVVEDTRPTWLLPLAGEMTMRRTIAPGADGAWNKHGTLERPRRPAMPVLAMRLRSRMKRHETTRAAHGPTARA